MYCLNEWISVARIPFKNNNSSKFWAVASEPKLDGTGELWATRTVQLGARDTIEPCTQKQESEWSEKLLEIPQSLFELEKSLEIHIYMFIDLLAGKDHANHIATKRDIQKQKQKY